MAERINFTKAVIDALPLPREGQRAEYCDTKTGGLRLRITHQSIKTFCVLRRVKEGGMERVTLGRYPDVTIEQARRAAAEINAAIAGGANPAEAKRAHKAEPIFADLFTEYMERHAKLNKRTWREDQQKYRDYLEQPLGKKKLSKITRADLAGVHSQITRAGHPTVANRVKDLCSSVFGRAIEWGLMEHNPAKGIRDNSEKSRDRFLQPGELPRLFAALSDEPNPNFRDFFLLALLTGARRHNVRSMRWADLDLEHALWHIPVTKNGQPQNVPLVPEAVEILRGRLDALGLGNGFVFPAARADSKHGHMSGERKAWLRILQRARVEDVHIHDLRRTMGSWQARTGASMVVIGKSLGHRSQQATAVYARLDLDPVRQAMQTATSAMLEAAGVKLTAEVVNLKRKERANP
jgi:integrase